MSAKLILPDALFIGALAIVVAIAARTDVFSRRIPNWLCAVTLLLGLGYVALTQGWPGAGLAALHVAAALVVTMAMFALRMIGAGDAKFYAAMAAWLPIGKGLVLLVAVALSGLALLLVFYFTRLRGRARRAGNLPSDFDKLPYGIAIGLGGLIAVLVA